MTGTDATVVGIAPVVKVTVELFCKGPPVGPTWLYMAYAVFGATDGLLVELD